MFSRSYTSNVHLSFIWHHNVSKDKAYFRNILLYRQTKVNIENKEIGIRCYHITTVRQLFFVKFKIQFRLRKKPIKYKKLCYDNIIQTWWVFFYYHFIYQCVCNIITGMWIIYLIKTNRLNFESRKYTQKIEADSNQIKLGFVKKMNAVKHRLIFNIFHYQRKYKTTDTIIMKKYQSVYLNISIPMFIR